MDFMDAMDWMDFMDPGGFGARDGSVTVSSVLCHFVPALVSQRIGR